MFIKVSGLILLLFIVGIPLFLHLDVLPFRIWDESRLAANAYEMHKDGNWIVTHYEDKPEMWNTKPPLTIWLQVMFIKLLGFSELAIRLPSAISGLLTCAVLIFFSYYFFRNLFPGVFASLVLITINGYVEVHSVRTGDYEGLLTLFTTAFILSGLLYSEQTNKKSIILFFSALTLSVLTKSIQPLLFLPGIAIWFLINNKLKLLFKKPFLIGVSLVVTIIAAYYITREIMNPGYLNAVWENELGGRYLKPLEYNDEGPLYYIKWMRFMLPYWLWFLPIAIVSGLLSKDKQIKKLTLYTFILSATYFIFITISKTKLYWYVVPLFPLISLNIALFIYQSYQYLKQFNILKRVTVFPLLIVCIVFIYPYLKIVKKVYHPKEYSWDKMYPISELLQDALHGKTSMNNKVISYNDFDQHLKIYTEALSDKGQHIQYKPPENLLNGDTVLASEPEVFTTIETKYKYDLIKDEHGVRIYLIK